VSLILPDPTASNAKSEDFAVAYRVQYGTVSFLITSDLTVNEEQALIDAHQDLRSAVLWLPTHGNDNANAQPFLNAVGPQVVVIPVDTGNRAAQPPDTTLKRLGTIPIFRTDQQGTLAFESDGTTLWVRPERQS